MLAGCPQLTSLRLYSCAGPLTDALALSPLLAPRAPAFRLQQLALSWSNVQLTDRGLQALLDPAVAAVRCLSLRGCGGVTDGGVWPALRQHASTLESLEIEDCGSLLARRKLAAVLGQAGAAGPEAGAGCQGAQEAGGAASGSMAQGGGVGEHDSSRCTTGGFSAGPSVGLPAPLTPAAAEEALEACERLRALSIRGSVEWGAEGPTLRGLNGAVAMVLEP